MKTLRTAAITVVFSILLLQSVCVVVNAQSSSATVVVEGNQTKTIENGTYAIDQIIVRNSSTLTIQNAKILSRADYQNWSISVRDNAKLIMINSTIMNPSGTLLGSPARKPFYDEWLTDPTTGNALPSSNIELDGDSISSTINGSVVYGAISVGSGPRSNISISNSTFYYADLHGNGTNVRIANSTALTDYGLIHGSDTVAISDSSFEGFDLVLAASTDLSLRPGLVNTWRFSNSLSFVNESYDLLVQNTKINSWGVQLYGDGNITLIIDNSVITHVTNYANIMKITNSNITYFATSGSDQIQNCTISQVDREFYDKNDFVFDNSTATYFQFTIWSSQLVVFSNLRENSTEPRILPEGLFGNIRFTDSRVQSWIIAMLEGSTAMVEISNSSKVYYIAEGGNSHVSIDGTSTVSGIRITQNGTAQITRIIQCRTQDGTPIKQTRFQLSNNNKTVLETTTDDYGKVFFVATLDANNYTLYKSNLLFEIQTGPLTIDWGNGTRSVFLGYTGDALEPENALTLGMDSPISIVANWETLYQLKVDSSVSVVNGSGWYQADSTANFSVTLPPSNPLVQEIFTGWSGDSTSIAPTVQIVMDKPKTVTANWRLDYTQVYLVVFAIIIIAAIASVAFVLTSRKDKFKPKRRPS